MLAHRLTRSAALALTAVVLAAPAAAAPSQDLRSPDARDAAGSAPTAERQDLRAPDTRDHAAGRGTFSAPDIMVVKLQPTASSDHGTAWRDAALGAGALLMAIILTGGYVLVRRRTGVPGRAFTALADSTREWRRGFGL